MWVMRTQTLLRCSHDLRETALIAMLESTAFISEFYLYTPQQSNPACETNFPGGNNFI